MAAAEEGPQWRFRYEQSPPHRCEDTELSLLVTSPLELVHNTALLSRIHDFFAVAGEPGPKRRFPDQLHDFVL